MAVLVVGLVAVLVAVLAAVLAVAMAAAMAAGPRDQWGLWGLLALLVQCHQWVQQVQYHQWVQSALGALQDQWVRLNQNCNFLVLVAPVGPEDQVHR